MTRGTGVHDLVAAGITTAAGRILAEQGDLPSMAEVAAAAGVGRATLYRYFPTRDALMAKLLEEALVEVEGLLEDAELDQGEFRPALLRFAGILGAALAKFEVLSRFFPDVTQGPLAEDDPRTQPAVLVLGLFARGIREGALRDDLSVDQHAALFVATVRTVGSGGPERAVSVYLDGAARS